MNFERLKPGTIVLLPESIRSIYGKYGKILDRFYSFGTREPKYKVGTTSGHLFVLPSDDKLIEIELSELEKLIYDFKKIEAFMSHKYSVGTYVILKEYAGDEHCCGVITDCIMMDSILIVAGNMGAFYYRIRLANKNWTFRDEDDVTPINLSELEKLVYEI